MTAGRPSKYDPAYCDQVVEIMADGYSLTAFAGTIRVHRGTLNEWMAVHPEFSEAVKKGKAACAVWWESANRANALSGQGNATSCIFGLKNMAPDEWRDKHEVEHTGPAPVTRIEIVAPGQDDNSPS